MNEEQKRDRKANSETIDQKEEKHSISLTSGTRLQPEVFDSYRYSAMSEMKEVQMWDQIMQAKYYQSWKRNSD